MSKWTRLTINLDPQMAKAAKSRARGQRRSFAAYVTTLIEQDMSLAVKEDAAPYLADPPKSPAAKMPQPERRPSSA